MSNIRIADQNLDIPMQLQSVKVADLTRDDEEWNWDISEQCMSEDIMNIIASILPPSVDAGPNVRARIRENCNNFYVGTMYKLLDGEDTQHEDNSWKDIWKIQAFERV